jgi:hypothetical protein
MSYLNWLTNDFLVDRVPVFKLFLSLFALQ